MRGTPQPSIHDDAESELVYERVIVSRMRGYITRILMESRFDQFRTLLTDTKNPIWIIECLELTGFDSGSVHSGARWFSAFKDRGGDRVLFVSHHSAARMVAASLAFAVHAKFSAVETLKDAYERAGLGAVEVRPSLFTLSPPSGCSGQK